MDSATFETFIGPRDESRFAVSHLHSNSKSDLPEFEGRQTPARHRPRQTRRVETGPTLLFPDAPRRLRSSAVPGWKAERVFMLRHMRLMSRTSVLLPRWHQARHPQSKLAFLTRVAPDAQFLDSPSSLPDDPDVDRNSNWFELNVVVAESEGLVRGTTPPWRAPLGSHGKRNMITDKEENTRRVLRRKKGYRGSASRLKLCKVAPISLHRKSGKVEDVQMLVNWQSEEVVYVPCKWHVISSLCKQPRNVGRGKKKPVKSMDMDINSRSYRYQLSRLMVDGGLSCFSG